jgi:hypothetical protein
MCLRSAGSALNRSTPEGADRRRTGCGRTSVVVLPPSRVGAADRVAVGWAMVLGLDINLRNGKVEADPYEHEAGVGHLLRRVQTDRRECLVQALSGGRQRRAMQVKVQQGEG